MAIKYNITEENLLELRKAMNCKNNSKYYKKLLSVALRGEGKSNVEVAEITQYHHKRVSQLVSLYCNEGIEALLSDGRKGGNNRVMSKEKAIAFLKQFEEKAEKGQIVTVEEIAKEYDEITGKSRKSHSSVYSFLHRNDWRMVMPRGQHPKKASTEEIAASKKLKTITTR